LLARLLAHTVLLTDTIDIAIAVCLFGGWADWFIFSVLRLCPRSLEQPTTQTNNKTKTELVMSYGDFSDPDGFVLMGMSH
jgi:hypothetical protein